MIAVLFVTCRKAKQSLRLFWDFEKEIASSPSEVKLTSKNNSAHRFPSPRLRESKKVLNLTASIRPKTTLSIIITIINRSLRKLIRRRDASCSHLSIEADLRRGWRVRRTLRFKRRNTTKAGEILHEFVIGAKAKKKANSSG
jgi:hypothetical protein